MKLSHNEMRLSPTLFFFLVWQRYASAVPRQLSYLLHVNGRGGWLRTESSSCFESGGGGWGGGGGASDDLAAAGRRRGAEQAVAGAAPPLDVDGDGLLAQR